MQNNNTKLTSTQVNYGENYYAPLANFPTNNDLESHSNSGYPQIDNDAFKAQQAGYQVESNTKKIYTIYEHYPEPQQVIQTVMKPRKPHNCGNCAECEERKKKESEERFQRERDECIGGCLIEFCCLLLCKALLNSR